MLLVRGINKWVVTPLHNSRSTRTVLTTAFPIPRRKLFASERFCSGPGEGPTSSQENHAGRGTGIATAIPAVAIQAL